MINNPKTNLHWILDWIDVGDHYIFDRLVRKWNDWIEARLWNINNMLDYSIAHPWDMSKYNDLVIKKWLSKIIKQVNDFSKKWVFKVDVANLNKIRDLKSKVLLVNK